MTPYLEKLIENKQINWKEIEGLYNSFMSHSNRVVNDTDFKQFIQWKQNDPEDYKNWAKNTLPNLIE